MNRAIGNRAIKYAFQKGYRVNDDGFVVSFTGKLLKVFSDSTEHMFFHIRMNGYMCNVAVHRLCAYQKYGDIFFMAQCVRHLDGNPRNNKPENIEIGSFSDNQLDIPKELRIKRAKYVSHCNQAVRSDELVHEINKYYATTKSYKETMERFGISSKGTLYYILNKRQKLNT